MDKPKLLDRMASALKARHYSKRTVEAYVWWAKKYILFHKKRHPSAMGADEANAFLTHLAVEEKLSAATQNQALAAILFLYRHVLEAPLPWLKDLVKAKRAVRLPVVMSTDEVRAVINASTGIYNLIFRILYGSGLRLMECLMLRVKDVDFNRGQIVVRDPKGHRDRLTMLPNAIVDDLRLHLDAVKIVHMNDLTDGAGQVWLPNALAQIDPLPPRVLALLRPNGRNRTPPPPPRKRRPTRHQRNRRASRPKEESDLPHLPPQLRHPPPGARPRHPHRPGTPRPPRRRHNDDLHPRPPPRPPRRPQPSGPHLTERYRVTPLRRPNPNLCRGSPTAEKRAMNVPVHTRQ